MLTSELNDYETEFDTGSLDHVWIHDIYSKMLWSIKLGTNQQLKQYRKTFTPGPGWNDRCRSKYKVARETFL